MQTKRKRVEKYAERPNVTVSDGTKKKIRKKMRLQNVPPFPFPTAAWNIPIRFQNGRLRRVCHSIACRNLYRLMNMLSSERLAIDGPNDLAN